VGEVNRVIYCGFGRYPGSPPPPMGGFLSGARMVLESPLFDHTEFALNVYTHPGEGSYARRFVEDVRRFRESLRRHPQHETVLVQVGQYRAIYREWALGWMARRAGRKLVLDIRAGTVLDFLDRDGNALERLLFGRLVRMSDLVLVQCRSFVAELRRRYPDVDFDWFANFVRAERVAPPRADPYRAGQRLRLVYFGYYIREKGLLEMIEAVRRCREAGLDVELHLAGTGKDEPEVERAVAAAAQGDGVVDHGYLRPGRLWELLGSMHALVYPTSHWGEGHTNAINEALMSGLAVVATPHKQLPDILPDAGTRWLDPGRLVDSLVEEIGYLAAHPDYVNEAGASNRAFLLESYTDRRWIPYLEGRLDALRAAAQNMT
jgi:glycosyltransferase involved in cell wall biosynthesis